MNRKQRVNVNGRFVRPCLLVADLLAFDPDTLSPEPNQLQGPETYAMIEIKRYVRSRNWMAHQWDVRQRISLPKFLTLTSALATLLDCRVIRPRLARSLADSIARVYRGR